MMVPSKDISDYTAISFLMLRPNEALPFSVYLYFERSQHILILIKKNEAPSQEFLEKYKAKHLSSVWVHRTENEALKSYTNKAEPTSKSKKTLQPAPQTLSSPPRTELGNELSEIIQNPHLAEAEKKELVAGKGQELLHQLVNLDDPAAIKAAEKQAWETIQDLLDAAGTSVSSSVAEIWKLASVDPDLEHATNVATYAVIFALAFGRIDESLIADLAFAGLLHDIGLCQIPSTYAVLPWKTLDPAEVRIYSQHVTLGLQILDELIPDLPVRVKALISQHHEKFDGTGFPEGKKGFQIDDVAQLLGLADLLHAMSTGQWDGLKRNLKDTFTELERLEKARTFPEYFNPDIFSAVMQWIRSKPKTDVTSQASKVVGGKAHEIVKSKKAS